MCILGLCVCVCVHTVQCLRSGGRCPQSSSQLAKSRLDPSRLPLVENIKNMVAGGELVADIKPTNFYVSLQTMFTSGQLSTIFPRGVRLSSVRGC